MKKRVELVLVLLLVTSIFFVSTSVSANVFTDFLDKLSGKPQIQLSPTISGLVAYYPFDINSADQSGKGNNLGCSSMSTCPGVTNGKISKAYNFDGVDDQYLDSSTVSLDINQYTVSAWVKTSTKQGRMSIIEFTKSSANGNNRRGIAIAGNTEGGKPIIYYGNDKMKTGNTGDLRDGNWHHIMGIYNGTNALIYVDGSSVSLGAESTANAGGYSSYLRVGNSLTSGESNYFSGAIDDIRIYSRALSSSEIQEVYTFSGSTTCTSNWQCGSWSSCENGVQKRTCTDSNNCGATSGKPDEIMSCSFSFCGNEIIETGEGCDDGNTINGDGCSSSCQIESQQSCINSCVFWYGNNVPVPSQCGNTPWGAVSSCVGNGKGGCGIYLGTGITTCDSCNNGACLQGSNSTNSTNQYCVDTDGIVEQKEINEGTFKNVAGLNIKMINADESNTALKATINVEGYGDISLTDQANEYGFLLNGINYRVELVSASDIAATIRVNSQINYNVKGGNTEVSDSGITTTYGDTCSGSQVNEYYCSGLHRAITKYNCPNGCEDGACVEQQGVAKYIIEKNISNFLISHVSFMSDWNLNSCEFFEFDGGIGYLPKGDACINELGDYNYDNIYYSESVRDNVEVLIEVHIINVSNDNFDRMVKGIYNSGYSSINFETILGNKVVLLGKEGDNDEAITFLWRSNDKIIGISLIDNKYLLDSDLEEFLKAYLNKFPSTLDEIVVSQCSTDKDCGGSIEKRYCDDGGNACVQVFNSICENGQCVSADSSVACGLCSDGCEAGYCIKNPQGKCSSGCEFNNQCIPIGIRQLSLKGAPSYCDVDGQLKPQMVNVAGESWPKCQNNYECESNACSSGECLPIAQTIRESGKVAKFVFSILCRIANPFNDEEYNQCLINFLGEENSNTGDSKYILRESFGSFDFVSASGEVVEPLDDFVNTFEGNEFIDGEYGKYSGVFNNGGGDLKSTPELIISKYTNEIESSIFTDFISREFSSGYYGGYYIDYDQALVGDGWVVFIANDSPTDHQVIVSWISKDKLIYLVFQYNNEVMLDSNFEESALSMIEGYEKKYPSTLYPIEPNTLSKNADKSSDDALISAIKNG